MWGGYKKRIRYSATDAGWSMGKRRALRRWAGCMAGVHGKGCWFVLAPRPWQKEKQDERASRPVDLNVFAGLCLAVQGTAVQGTLTREQFAINSHRAGRGSCRRSIKLSTRLASRLINARGQSWPRVLSVRLYCAGARIRRARPWIQYKRFLKKRRARRDEFKRPSEARIFAEV